MKKNLLLLALLCYAAGFSQTNYVMDFDGVFGSVDVGKTVGNGVRSIEFWFKPASNITPSTPRGGYSFIVRNDASEYREFGAYIRGNEWATNIGQMVFYLRDNGIDHEIFSNSSTWNAGTWYHFAGVVDPSTGMKMYINGVLQANTDASATFAVQTDTNQTSIGTWGDANMRNFDGRIEEMRLWSRAISQSEVQAKMCQNLIPANETGLQAYWKFNEGSGSQIQDATANNNDGTVYNTTWVIDDPCGTSSSYYVLDFNGTSSGVNLGTSVGNGVRSIEFWFRPTAAFTSSTTIGGWTLIVRDDNTQVHEYGMYMRGNSWSTNIGKLAFFVRDNGTMHEIYSNSNSWAAGTWYHVAGVVDASSGMKLYINGVLQSSTDASCTIATQTDANPSYLGTWGSSGLRYFDGRMDELRLWNRAITQSEIQAKMCQQLVAANETGLQGYWQFDEGSGTQVLDETANGYNGSVSSVTWIAENFCGIGVHDLQSPVSDIAVYPNPTNGALSVFIGNNYEEVYFTICNSLGQVLRNSSIHESETRLDLSGLDNGVYYLTFVQGDRSFCKKIVVQK